MARIRTIKPEFFTSLVINDLQPVTRLSFIGIWTHADDAGRCIDDARLIKAAVSPLERTVAAVEGDLVALAASGLLIRYSQDGRRFIQVANWKEHQYINRPRESKLPAPQDVNDHGGLTEAARTAHARKGKERKGAGKGKEQGTPGTAVAVPESDPTEFETFWELYPRKVSKPAARKAFTAARKKAGLETIISGLRLHVPSLAATEERYQPHPSTWLNGERWSDPPPPMPGVKKGDIDWDLAMERARLIDAQRGTLPVGELE